MKRKITRFIERTLAITGALLIAFHLFFEVSTFTTGSMAPLLMGMEKGEPDTVLVEKRFTRGRAPARFQVVAFTNDDGVDVAKRVVGLPGETIQVLRDRTLLIDGRPMKTPVEVDDGHGYVGVGNLSLGRPFKVPPGQVYVLGDDTHDSLDSRWQGGIAVERIHGRVFVRVWPLARLRWLS